MKNPDKYTKEICEYLEIEFHTSMLNSFSNQHTKGRMGDPTGIKEYKSVSPQSLDKWKDTFNTKYRQKLIKKYINSIDNEVLELQGYDKNSILYDIEQLDVTNSNLLRDIVDKFYSDLIRFFKPNIWFGKTIKVWARDRYLS